MCLCGGDSEPFTCDCNDSLRRNCGTAIHYIITPPTSSPDASSFFFFELNISLGYQRYCRALRIEYLASEHYEGFIRTDWPLLKVTVRSSIVSGFKRPVQSGRFPSSTHLSIERFLLVACALAFMSTFSGRQRFSMQCDNTHLRLNVGDSLPQSARRSSSSTKPPCISS